MGQGPLVGVEPAVDPNGHDNRPNAKGVRFSDRYEVSEYVLTSNASSSAGQSKIQDNGSCHAMGSSAPVPCCAPKARQNCFDEKPGKKVEGSHSCREQPLRWSGQPQEVSMREAARAPCEMANGLRQRESWEVGSVVEVYSASVERWFVAMVIQVLNNSAVAVRFIGADGGLHVKTLARSDMQLAPYSSNTAELPPGFQAVPSKSRPGQLAYLDLITSVKYPNVEMAWHTAIERAIHQHQSFKDQAQFQSRAPQIEATSQVTHEACAAKAQRDAALGQPHGFTSRCINDEKVVFDLLGNIGNLNLPTKPSTGSEAGADPKTSPGTDSASLPLTTFAAAVTSCSPLAPLVGLPSSTILAPHQNTTVQNPHIGTGVVTSLAPSRSSIPLANNVHRTSNGNAVSEVPSTTAYHTQPHNITAPASVTLPAALRGTHSHTALATQVDSKSQMHSAVASSKWGIPHSDSLSQPAHGNVAELPMQSPNEHTPVSRGPMPYESLQCARPPYDLRESPGTGHIAPRVVTTSKMRPSAHHRGDGKGFNA